MTKIRKTTRESVTAQRQLGSTCASVGDRAAECWRGIGSERTLHAPLIHEANRRNAEAACQHQCHTNVCSYDSTDLPSHLLPLTSSNVHSDQAEEGLRWGMGAWMALEGWCRCPDKAVTAQTGDLGAGAPSGQHIGWGDLAVEAALERLRIKVSVSRRRES